MTWWSLNVVDVCWQCATRRVAEDSRRERCDNDGAGVVRVAGAEEGAEGVAKVADAAGVRGATTVVALGCFAGGPTEEAVGEPGLFRPR